MRKIIQQGKGFFRSKLSKAFGKNSGLELPLSSREEKTSGVSAYSTNYNYHKELRNFMLDAEKLKAKAVMEMQRRRLGY